MIPWQRTARDKEVRPTPRMGVGADRQHGGRTPRRPGARTRQDGFGHAQSGADASGPGGRWQRETTPAPAARQSGRAGTEADGPGRQKPYRVSAGLQANGHRQRCLRCGAEKGQSRLREGLTPRRRGGRALRGGARYERPYPGPTAKVSGSEAKANRRGGRWRHRPGSAERARRDSRGSAGTVQPPERSEGSDCRRQRPEAGGADRDRALWAGARHERP